MCPNDWLNFSSEYLAQLTVELKWGSRPPTPEDFSFWAFRASPVLVLTQKPFGARLPNRRLWWECKFPQQDKQQDILRKVSATRVPVEKGSSKLPVFVFERPRWTEAEMFQLFRLRQGSRKLAHQMIRGIDIASNTRHTGTQEIRMRMEIFHSKCRSLEIKAEDSQMQRSRWGP